MEKKKEPEEQGGGDERAGAPVDALGFGDPSDWGPATVAGLAFRVTSRSWPYLVALTLPTFLFGYGLVSLWLIPPILILQVLIPGVLIEMLREGEPLRPESVLREASRDIRDVADELKNWTRLFMIGWLAAPFGGFVLCMVASWRMMVEISERTAVPPDLRSDRPLGDKLTFFILAVVLSSVPMIVVQGLSHAAIAGAEASIRAVGGTALLWPLKISERVFMGVVGLTVNVGLHLAYVKIRAVQARGD